VPAGFASATSSSRRAGWRLLASAGASIRALKQGSARSQVCQGHHLDQALEKQFRRFVRL
jgi:hypothetical protein